MSFLANLLNKLGIKVAKIHQAIIAQNRLESQPKLYSRNERRKYGLFVTKNRINKGPSPGPFRRVNTYSIFERQSSSRYPLL